MNLNVMNWQTNHSLNVSFTDFDLAVDFTNASGSTTVRMVNGIAARYYVHKIALYEIL